MFNLLFSLELDSDIISGFELGDIHLSYNGDSVTSWGKTPNQSFMVFVTIIDLLNGLEKMISNTRMKEYNLVCADSSFSVLFIKTKDMRYRIRVENKDLCTLEKNVLVKEVYNSCSNLYNKHRSKMLDTDPVIEDVESALTRFKMQFYIQ